MDNVGSVSTHKEVHFFKRSAHHDPSRLFRKEKLTLMKPYQKAYDQVNWVA
uniref:AlNc14C95G5830 protein n=1 Tax=Albugo laibachii Nc14 TaxID=890382 RepID=F0WGV4_9STRA|nr:AlNc14C95G5830 [Albugo laibachii Nc14]|eukprot:CCA20469.1 AlNc14C95G5830 [Albugo laibachii Nc14]